MGAPDPVPASGCDCADTGDGSRCGGTLPDSPECAINYHFGMLLGVGDFRAEQGFHLGHARRHQRALHGYGVVYGYAVSFAEKGDELRVEKGYALDRAGRDVFLGDAQCLSLPAWWEKHRDDPAFADLPKEDATFDADVLLCYRTCLSRPVPAIADPCEGASADIAYSRICESVELTLVRRRADEARPYGQGPLVPPYHLLRLLAGLDAPLPDADDATHADYEWLQEQRDEIAALPAADRDAATRLLWQAAIARAAAATTDPTSDPVLASPPDPGDGSGSDTGGCLVIARLGGVHIFEGPKGLEATVGSIDIDQRMTLLPSQLLQAVLLRPDVAAAPSPPAGPVVLPDGATIAGANLKLHFDQSLAPASVRPSAFAVTEFVPAAGWASFTLGSPAYDETEHRVTLPLDRAPIGARVRVTVRGTGPTPLLGADLTPAGAATRDGDGADLSTTLTGS